MNVEFEIEKQILIDALKDDGYEVEFEMPSDENLHEFYCENYMELASIIDAEQEFRCSGIETDLEAQYSRHYESAQVAKKLDSGVWVSWTYWYGGGKHGEPDAVDWTGSAYQVDCSEEEKTVVVRTFNKLDK